MDKKICCNLSVELETVVLARKQNCKIVGDYFSHFPFTAAFSANATLSGQFSIRPSRIPC